MGEGRMFDGGFSRSWVEAGVRRWLLGWAIKILLLRSTIWSSEPEAKNALAKIRHISRIGPIGLNRFSCSREYAPRIETKPLDSTKKGRRNPPAFSNSLSTVFLRSCSRLTLFWVDGAENQLINFRLHLDDVVRLNVAPQQFFSQRILQKPLNRPTHRTRAIDGIVAFLDK